MGNLSDEDWRAASRAELEAVKAMRAAADADFVAAREHRMALEREIARVKHELADGAASELLSK